MKKSVIMIAISVAISSTATFKIFNHYYNPVDDVKNYLLENPEFIIDVSEALNEKQELEQNRLFAQQVLEYANDLLSDDNIVVGKKDAPITIIEFFDYQCPFCQRFAPAIQHIIENNEDVRVIFMETPVLSGRFPISALAAKFGISIYNHYGAEKYQQYHDSLFSKNIPEGQLSIDDLKTILDTIGVEADKLDMDNASYDKNIELFRNVGLRGTPASILLPTVGANESNIFLIDGSQPNILFSKLKKLKG
ncbi:thioredoxin domain-containing protein [Vibrio furnissii]|uniref:DsbA family protein n=1 Tax=Vibrio furnissii TaxID=29494 RepID=UPI001C9D311C|nr:thioredoxin domain-containing protein [Vibrio fluvialis]MCG6230264.1 thioredoxin domain-containing protein [Vibrio furnissii]